MGETEQKRLLPRFFTSTLAWLVLFYVLSYFAVRHVYEQHSVIPGSGRYATVFDADMLLERITYTVYWPLGYCDELVTGRRYELRDHLF